MNILTDLLNDLRDGVLTKNEIRKRQELNGVCQLSKVAAVAGAVASIAVLLLSIISLSPWAIVFGTLFVAGSLIICYDIFRIADNMQQIIDDAKTEIFVSLTKNAFKEHIVKGTLLARYIVNLVIE